MFLKSHCGRSRAEMNMPTDFESGRIEHSKTRSSSRSSSSSDEAAELSTKNFLNALIARFLAAPLRRDDRGITAELEVRVTPTEVLRVLDLAVKVLSQQPSLLRISRSVSSSSS